MFFTKTKYKDEQNSFMDSLPKTFLVWLEIGVSDMGNAIRFYENVFKVQVEIRYLFDRKIGIFYKDNNRLNVCLIERENSNNQNSVKPTFFVDVIFETTKNVERNGGKIILPSTLLRQKNERGETIIGSNLIDDQQGYMAEVMDTEGNAILLYSHS